MHLETFRRNSGYAYDLSTKILTDKIPDQYFNVPDKYLGELPNGTTYGKGSFREARLLVDGHLAGVAFPYIAIYTGGFVPAAWRWVISYLLAPSQTHWIVGQFHRTLYVWSIFFYEGRATTPFLGA